MLYCNCHYRYKGQLCEVLGFLSTTNADDSKKVRIRLQTDNYNADNHNKEVICSENDLEEIPLTEYILQSCFKSKTYVRDGEWDILWHLGGKNNVTIGEKEGRFYRMPSESIQIVTEVLPQGIVQGEYITGLKGSCRLDKLSEFEITYPELKNILLKSPLVNYLL